MWVDDFIVDPARWIPEIALVGIFSWFVFDSRKKITQAIEQFTKYLKELDEKNEKLVARNRKLVKKFRRGN